MELLTDGQIDNLGKAAVKIIIHPLQDQLLLLSDQLDAANKRLDENNKQIERLTEQIRLMNQRRFGSSSEKSAQI